MANELLKRIQSADNLPSLPNVAVEILSLSKKENVSLDEITSVIQNDPALTGKLLKLVNSSMFGLSRKTGSIKQAVGLLGLRTVKVMALSFSLVDSFGDTDQEFDFPSFWRRSLTTAVASRLLARAMKSGSADEAFVAGLLSKIGMIAAWRTVPELYKPVLEAGAASRGPLCDLEQEHMGITSALIGREILRSWGVPEALSDAVGAHDGDGIAAFDRQSIPKIVNMGATIASLFLQDRSSTDVDAVKRRCQSELGVSEEKLEEVLGALDEQVREAASMLSVDVGTTVNYAQVQAEASTQLATLSMQAEVERADTARREEAARHEATRLHEEKLAILEFASTDGLTEIANRAAFDKRLEEEFARAGETGRPVGLIMLDVDHFKRFNDTYGHQAGDEVLKTVAACLRAEAGHVGLVARYGGEEFVVIVTGDDTKTIRGTAESVRRGVEKSTTKYDGQALKVTVSLGAACAVPVSGGMTCSQLIKSADEQLYAAKRGGRNRVAMALEVSAAT